MERSGGTAELTATSCMPYRKSMNVSPHDLLARARKLLKREQYEAAWQVVEPDRGARRARRRRCATGIASSPPSCTATSPVALRLTGSHDDAAALAAMDAALRLEPLSASLPYKLGLIHKSTAHRSATATTARPRTPPFPLLQKLRGGAYRCYRFRTRQPRARFLAELPVHLPRCPASGLPSGGGNIV